MSDNFDKLKTTWLSVDKGLFPDVEKVQTEITNIRKRKNKQVLLWYTGVIAFSILVIWYVLYTDELNSVSESIAEFILLFTSIFLFYNARKTIKHQQKEYMLHNVDFVKNIQDNEVKRLFKKVLITCICSTLFAIAIFLHFLDNLIASPLYLIITSILLVVFLLVIWVVLKPLYLKRMTTKNKQLLQKSATFLANINNL